jgi:uncharacterized protein (DUF433 family)
VTSDGLNSTCRSEPLDVTAKVYVVEDEQGALRVGDHRVSLDSVVITFQQGHSAETIQQRYPALRIEEVYGAIAYYLAHRDDVHRYLERQDRLWDQLRQQADQTPSAVVQRLRGVSTVAMRTAP